MQKIKKPLSIILAVLMVMSVFIAVPMSASALTIDDVQSLLSSMEAKINDYNTQGDWDRAGELKDYYDWLDGELEYADGQITPELESAYNEAYEYFMANSGSGVSYPDVNNVYRATNGWVNVTVSDLQPGDVLVTSDTLSVRKGDCDIVLVGGTYGEGDVDEGTLSRTYPNDVTLGNNISFLFGGNYARIYNGDIGCSYDPVYNNALGNAYMVIGNENGTVYLAGYYFTIYTVTWKNGDDVIKTDTVEEGATPTYDGETPTKAEDENYTYTFSGWKVGETTYALNEALPPVTGDVTYTATFTPVPKVIPAKLTINVGENGKVVMNGGVIGNAVDPNQITEFSDDLSVDPGVTMVVNNGESFTFSNDASVSLLGGSTFSVYPSADNTGVITAIPDEGYICTGWYNGDTLYSSDAALSYQSISEDITLTAKFAPEPAFADGVGERLAGYTLSLDGDIGVNFYMELAPAIAQSETAVMHFTIPNGANTTEVDVPVSEATVIGDYHIFKCNVAAKEMTSQIKAQIIDGEIEGTEYTYSVKEYADYLLTHTDVQEYADAEPLVIAMLNYGAYAQLYFYPDTDPDDLANVGHVTDITGVTAQSITSPACTDTLSETVIFSGATLSLKSETTLSLYFMSAGELEFKSDEITDGMTIETDQSGKYQIARIRGIKAAELQNSYRVEVWEEETGEYFGDVTYSPMTYCYNVLSDANQPEALQNVCRALVLYAEAASDYFNGAAPAQGEVISSSSIDDFSTLNVGDYLANGIDWSYDEVYTFVLTGGTYGTESRDGIVVCNDDFTFNAGEFFIGTYAYHVPQPNVYIEDLNENEKYYPYADGVEGNAFVVVAKDDNAKTITIAGANVALD